jgi:CBS domain-containing protein
MLIKDIIQEKGSRTVTIDAGETIHQAINSLNTNRIGALIAMGEDGEVVGIITERDILQVCGEHCGRMDDAEAQSRTGCPSLVKDAMTKEIVIGVPEDELNYAMGVMTKNRIRHLPILDNGQLAGIISIGDLVNAHLEEKVFENRTLRDYIQGSMR